MASEVCTCNKDENQLVLTVSQGERRGFNFTLLQDGEPLDLEGWTILVYVKNAPYSLLDPIISKEITTTSNYNTVGQITDATNGKFTINFTADELNLVPYDYYFVAEITDGYVTQNITHNGNYSAIFRVKEM